LEETTHDLMITTITASASSTASVIRMPNWLMRWHVLFIVRIAPSIVGSQSLHNSPKPTRHSPGNPGKLSPCGAVKTATYRPSQNRIDGN
jgi:hypothetical protein